MKKVLVIEDDRAIRELISAALVEAGYVVAAAKNGREGEKPSEIETFLEAIATHAANDEGARRRRMRRN